MHNIMICLTFTGVWHFSPLAALLSGLPPSTGNLSYSGHLPRTLLKSVFDYSGVGGGTRIRREKASFKNVTIPGWESPWERGLVGLQAPH